MTDLPDPEEMLAEMAQLPALTAYDRQKMQVERQAERARPQIGKVRYTHEDCIDRILAAPGISQNELAAIYGMQASWMSIVINSDAFKVRLAARKSELIDPVLAATLNERFGALAAKSVEVLLDKLNRPADQISDKLALEAASLGARAVGMGAPSPAGPTDAATHLAQIAHRLLDLNHPRPVIIESGS